jgi:hypothetical protein
MKRILFSLFSLVAFAFVSIAEAPYSVRGLCIAAPSPKEVDAFVKFIDEELAPKGVNTLILRVDFNFMYKSHPELVGNNPLTDQDISKLVQVCRKNRIRLIPQINLFGHQSWSITVGKLLEVYPEFDETPHVKFPKKYEWPNPDGLYCKSYCPLHPGVHKVVFEVVDEIMKAFEADAFHAGMDEVFYIGDDKCPRCGGRDKAELFAGEVTLISNHLRAENKELWIWGDRLIDGKTTGMGMWEASMNNTHRSIDLIPRDVVVCDWHYEKAHPTAAYFAAKGFRVLTCPWQNNAVALEQEKLTRILSNHSSKEMKPRYLGMMQTVWGSAGAFMESYLGKADPARADKSADCFKKLTEVWQNE